MTIKESILKSLEDIQGLASSLQVYNHIVNKGYYQFTQAKTPNQTVSALMGDFIRNGDARVKRIMQSDTSYLYYLTKFEDQIDISKEVPDKPQQKAFSERDLHTLLCSYLKFYGSFAKTIFHEKSKSSADANQKWSHPDMVAIKFQEMKSEVGKNFLKSTSQTSLFKIASYEIKKEIKSDDDLKKFYFQAVSNSSWANYGYLVAFSINQSLKPEMERLNQSFGIGIIELSSNVFESEELFPAELRELDYRTIDKLCNMNSDFKGFIQRLDNYIVAEDRFVIGAQKELSAYCDQYLENDNDVREYCLKHNIPIEDVTEE